MLKTFARPLDARGFRVHLRHLWETEQRAGGIDPRLVRNEDTAEDTANEPDGDARRPKTRRRSIPQVETARAADGMQTLSSRQAAAHLGLKQHRLRYMIDQGKICAIRRGRYWRITLAEVERLERGCQRLPELKGLRGALVLLRAHIHGGQLDSSRRWLDRKRAAGQLPRQVFEGLAADPQGQEWPELLDRIRELIESLSPETGWEA